MMSRSAVASAALAILAWAPGAALAADSPESGLSTAR